MSITSLRLNKFKKKGVPSTDQVDQEDVPSVSTIREPKFTKTPMEDSGKTGAKDRLNSILPIRANGFHGSANKVKDDETVDSLQEKSKKNVKEEKDLKEKIKYLKKLRGN